MRDIHLSHYGRICPIETPEGPNAGLIGVLATHARINSYGFIETPYYRVEDGKALTTSVPIYLAADQEDEFRIAPGDTPIDNEQKIKSEIVPVRYRQEFTATKKELVDYLAVSPIQVISIATSLIPFVEHDDANRALMGSNMQRQAVPFCISRKSPLIGTGLEAQAARDSGMVVVSLENGVVTYISADRICVTSKEGKEIAYNLQKYQRSNQDTCINQRPSVWLGEEVVTGQVIADGAATEGGELALGQNILIAYVPWEGYNYEDAFLVSERLVYNDVYTSVHIEKYEIEARQTKLGSEEITRELPNVGEYSLRKLDDNGIIVIGSWVESGDIFSRQSYTQRRIRSTSRRKVIKSYFWCEKAKDVRDTSWQEFQMVVRGEF